MKRFIYLLALLFPLSAPAATYPNYFVTNASPFSVVPGISLYVPTVYSTNIVSTNLSVTDFLFIGTAQVNYLTMLGGIFQQGVSFTNIFNAQSNVFNGQVFANSLIGDVTFATNNFGQNIVFNGASPTLGNLTALTVNAPVIAGDNIFGNISLSTNAAGHFPAFAEDPYMPLSGGIVTLTNGTNHVTSFFADGTNLIMVSYIGTNGLLSTLAIQDGYGSGAFDVYSGSATDTNKVVWMIFASPPINGMVFGADTIINGITMPYQKYKETVRDSLINDIGINDGELTFNTGPYVINLTSIGFVGVGPSLPLLSLPSLQTIDTVGLANDPFLYAIDCPNLTTVGSMMIDNDAAVTNLALPSLTSLNFSSANNCQALTNVSVPNLVMPAGCEMDFPGCGLWEGAIGHILTRAIASGIVDGFFDFSGGTNATPTGAVLADYQTLTNLGNTILINP